MIQRRFTLRRRQVAELLAEGLSNKQIAKRLGLSPHTVKDYVRVTLALVGCTRQELKGRALIDSPLTPPDWPSLPTTRPSAPLPLPPVDLQVFVVSLPALPAFPTLPPLPLTVGRTFDIEHAFKVVQGYAYLLGRACLMLLPGMVWPGLARLPEWLLELARPARITLSAGAQLIDHHDDVDDAYCAALGAQALVRAPNRQALAAAPHVVDQPLSSLDLARLVKCSQDTLRALGVVPARFSNLPPFARNNP
ncbi:helix-turn-helix transcriptional regulator [Deinococcus sp. QL22]|uniref:helix-turn-helix domain-containing protein n=1 Tax=Deinococcus sp. QL22 TaxID=2939437 RepID=UPI0020177E70|nr:helix-turn-helix transcriptional regulator [Deinococcus sp. QL22]UQN10326.1 helix-turn-helix transcriptional regulator [Deinococcus sp. QL22]UQN10460.1 helix-turn-helix transcriptional regulator [Deinococcus sp. QL22]